MKESNVFQEPSQMDKSLLLNSEFLKRDKIQIGIYKVTNNLKYYSSRLRSFKRNLWLARIISKSGRRHTFVTGLNGKSTLSFLKDWGHTFVNMRWRWIWIMLFALHMLFFIVFALLWMAIAKLSGDFERENIHSLDRCIVNTNKFAGYLLLSIETITSIGFGVVYPTESCKFFWVLYTVQAVVGIFIQGFLVSAVYSKLSKPVSNGQGSFFSNYAVICLRDGNLCLVFRINDEFGKIPGGTTVKLYFINEIWKDISMGPIDFKMIPLKTEPFGFLLFPTEIVHVIDCHSPFWTFSPGQLLTQRFEIIAVAEGTSRVTGKLSQTRTSYANSDILWGYRFVPCVEFVEKKMKYVVKCKLFNKTLPYNTPLCSAQQLKEIEYSLEAKIENDDQKNSAKANVTTFRNKT